MTIFMHAKHKIAFNNTIYDGLYLSYKRDFIYILSRRSLKNYNCSANNIQQFFCHTRLVVEVKLIQGG